MALGHSTCPGPALGCAWNPKSGAVVGSEREGGLELRDPGVYLLPLVYRMGSQPRTKAGPMVAEEGPSGSDH